MTTISQIVKTWDLQGVLDNGQDFIDQIVPEDTPFYNNITKVQHRTGAFQWITDVNDGDVLGHTLGTNVDNGRIEVQYADNVANGSSENAPLSKEESILNYTQRFRKFVKVSKTASVNAQHGKRSEDVYQIAKTITAIKNQIEGTFISGQTKRQATGNTPTTCAKTDGLTAQVPSYMFASANTAAGVAELCDKLFQNGSMADTIYANRAAMKALKHLMDVGDQVGPKLQWEESGKDWMTFTDANGRLYKLIAHRHLDEISEDNIVAIFLDHDNWSCVEFKPMTVTKLDTKGSYNEYMIECEVGLRNNAKYKTGVLAVAPTPSPAPKASTKPSTK